MYDAVCGEYSLVLYMGSRGQTQILRLCLASALTTGFLSGSISPILEIVCSEVLLCGGSLLV